MAESKSFERLLGETQGYLSRHYAGALSGENKYGQLKGYIRQYLQETNQSAEGFDVNETADRLFSEMAEYSVLTPYLKDDRLEEINVNAWNDISLEFADGHSEKAPETFSSPGQAEDIIRRLLHHSGMIIDNAQPVAQGHLPGNMRITAIKTPVVDAECAVSASIRRLKRTQLTPDELRDAGAATAEMLRFLCLCLRYGLSFVVAGATSSGKTTLLNALLATIPDSKRIFTIETGARELSLRKESEGQIVNNVIHTRSRPSDVPSSNITQEDLVALALRFRPDIIVVGEMRDTEAYAAVEASLTGHTVVSTVHASSASAAHLRIALLCQKRFAIDFRLSLQQAAQAFPLVVFTHRGEDHIRRISEISECSVDENGSLNYRTLFRFAVEANEFTEGGLKVRGAFRRENTLSGEHLEILRQNGLPDGLLDAI